MNKLSGAQVRALDAMSQASAEGRFCNYHDISSAGANGRTLSWLVVRGLARLHDDPRGKYWTITSAGQSRLEAAVGRAIA